MEVNDRAEPFAATLASLRQSVSDRWRQDHERCVRHRPELFLGCPAAPPHQTRKLSSCLQGAAAAAGCCAAWRCSRALSARRPAPGQLCAAPCAAWQAAAKPPGCCGDGQRYGSLGCIPGHLLRYVLRPERASLGHAAGPALAAQCMNRRLMVVGPPSTLLRFGPSLLSSTGLVVFWDELIALLAGRRRTREWRALVSGESWSRWDGCNAESQLAKGCRVSRQKEQHVMQQSTVAADCCPPTVVAGMLAGPAMLFTGSEQAHTSLALYVLIRGLTLLVRCGNLPDAHPIKRRLLAPTRWRHGDVALMCLSTAQIGYSWIALPQV